MHVTSLLLAWRRLPVLLRAVLAGALATAAGTLPWAFLVAMNVRRTPSVPWSVPITAAYLWLLFRYLRGEWWPASTSEARRRSCRANGVSDGVFGSAVIAGMFGLAALMLFQRVFIRMVHLPPQPVDELRAIPPLSLIAFVIMGSIVAGVTEEVGFRGYMQSPIERRHGPVVALLVTSVLFGLAHYSHRETTLLLMPFYISVGVIYGLMAFFANSIWPGIILHALGDVLGAAQLIATGQAEWQTSPERSPLIWDAGPDASFWISVVLFLVAVAAAVWAYRGLAMVARPLV